MLALGLGEKDIFPYLQKHSGKLMIACYNSPRSITVSGNVDEVKNLMVDLKSDNIFAQMLKTGGMAYHSSHMVETARFYEEYLQKAELALYDRSSLQPRCEMISSVTGSPMGDGAADATYWVDNLVKPVLFTQAMQTTIMLNRAIRVFAEIGPHPALSTPIKQIHADTETSIFVYIETLRRDADDGKQILGCADNLWAQGVSINISSVTKVERLLHEGNITEIEGALVLNLPTYQWTYSREYCQEPRHSKAIRSQKTPRHDLLGRRALSSLADIPSWRNVLRNKDVPWLKHHSVSFIPNQLC